MAVGQFLKALETVVWNEGSGGTKAVRSISPSNLHSLTSLPSTIHPVCVRAPADGLGQPLKGWCRTKRLRHAEETKSCTQALLSGAQRHSFPHALFFYSSSQSHGLKHCVTFGSGTSLSFFSAASVGFCGWHFSTG